MTAAHNPHRGLDPLVREIEDRDDPRLGIVYAQKFDQLLPRWLGPFRRAGEYIEVAVRIWGKRHKDTIIVREFSTFFIFLTILLTLPIRKKCLLLVAHNVQKAADSPVQRGLLLLLLRLGVRLAVLETDEGTRKVLRIFDTVVFPHPIDGMPDPASTTGGPALRVGIAGDMRPEKGFDFLVPIISAIASADLPLEFSIGTNTPRAMIPLPDSSRIKFVDTTDYRDFINYLAGIDVAIMPYPEENYRYRVSGVIAEATGQGTACLTIDLPTLRAQVMTPAVGGRCLPRSEFTEEGLRNALIQMSAQRETLSRNLAENSAARQPSRIVDTILEQL